jgi:hypothetical protein
LSLEASSIVFEDVDGKLRCINLRRVSDPWRAFLLAFRVTESASDTPGSADDKLECTW